MRSFITEASCQHLATFSASRPMPWVSVPKIEMAPMSWRKSSAATVCGADAGLAERRSSGVL